MWDRFFLDWEFCRKQRIDMKSQFEWIKKIELKGIGLWYIAFELNWSVFYCAEDERLFQD